MNENNEIMTAEANEMPVSNDCGTTEVTKERNGITGTVALLGLITGMTMLIVKKCKAHSSDTTKKKVKKRLKWVEIEDDTSEAEVVDSEEVYEDEEVK